MQNLEVISVNIWNILISLANLALLFWAVKKFLFKPVRAVFEKREADIAKRYSEADIARAEAQNAKTQLEEKLKGAHDTADVIIKDAQDAAKRRADSILEDANARAESILKHAEDEAQFEMRKAREDIKREIVDVSALLAEKMLEREVKIEDHRAMVDSFIDTIGDDND